MKLGQFIKTLEVIEKKYGDDLEVTMADYIPVVEPRYLPDNKFGNKVIITDKNEVSE